MGRRSRRGGLLVGLGVGLLVLCLAGALCPFGVLVVQGDSMEPALHGGAVYVMDRRALRIEAPQRGDVVVFETNGSRYVKRVAGTAGETVTLLRRRDEGEVELEVIRGAENVRRVRRLVSSGRWSTWMQVVEMRVPPGTCYVIGDNAGCSVDSRTLGPIPLDSIRGRVMIAREPYDAPRLAAVPSTSLHQ